MVAAGAGVAVTVTVGTGAGVAVTLERLVNVKAVLTGAGLAIPEDE